MNHKSTHFLHSTTSWVLVLVKFFFVWALGASGRTGDVCCVQEIPSSLVSGIGCLAREELRVEFAVRFRSVRCSIKSFSRTQSVRLVFQDVLSTAKSKYDEDTAELLSDVKIHVL